MAPMSVSPFALPLTPAQFASALHKGQGRALLHVRAAGPGDPERILADACLHNRALDPQCEHDRTDWLLHMVEATRAGAQIAEWLIARCDDPTDEYWDAVQRCALLRKLAQRGHEGARPCLYRCLRKWPDFNDIIGAEEIVALDGADGLVRVAEFLGSLIQETPELWLDDEPLCLFDESRGAGSGRRLLEAEMARSPSISAYLRHLDEIGRKKAEHRGDAASGGGGPNQTEGGVPTKQPEPKPRSTWPTSVAAACIVRRIETEDPPQQNLWLGQWGRRASEDALATVFAAMKAQTDPGRLRSYLQVFSQRAAPVLDEVMFRYADHDCSEVRGLAHRALANHAHADVRRLALKRLRAGRVLEHELKLLSKNYQPGDAAVIEQALCIPGDRHELHRIVCDLVKVFRANQLPELANVMLFVYEVSPCSHCRCDAVEGLVQTSSAPGWLHSECQHDAWEEIRALAGRHTPAL